MTYRGPERRREERLRKAREAWLWVIVGAGVLAAGLQLRADLDRPEQAPDRRAEAARFDPRFDPTLAPPQMAADCRREGKMLAAYRQDGGDWIYDCTGGTDGRGTRTAAHR